MLRGISKKLGISVLDGADIGRIRQSEEVIYPDRIPEEDFVRKITSIDKARRNKEFQLQYHDIKFSLIDHFGAGTINRALEYLLSSLPLRSRLTPTRMRRNRAAADLFCWGDCSSLLDYIGSEVAFRATEERQEALINAIRFGDIDETAGLERIRLAIGLLQKYAPTGEATARAVELAVKQDFKNIPAEIIAEYVVKSTKPEDLFQVARRLEHVAFLNAVTSSDGLGME